MTEPLFIRGVDKTTPINRQNWSELCEKSIDKDAKCF